jgi:hypothetical protein
MREGVFMDSARKEVDEFGRVITRMEKNADGEMVEVLGKQNENWVTGTARDIVHMSQTPEYVEVAKAMLAGGSRRCCSFA